jgi:hypothetical protein
VLDRLLALYGAARVIRAHTALRELEREKGTQDPAVRSGFAALLVDIRGDLGAEASRNLAATLERLLLPAGSAADNGVAAGGRSLLVPGA